MIWETVPWILKSQGIRCGSKPFAHQNLGVVVSPPACKVLSWEWVPGTSMSQLFLPIPSGCFLSDPCVGISYLVSRFLSEGIGSCLVDYSVCP